MESPKSVAARLLVSGHIATAYMGALVIPETAGVESIVSMPHCHGFVGQAECGHTLGAQISAVQQASFKTLNSTWDGQILAVSGVFGSIKFFSLVRHCCLGCVWVHYVCPNHSSSMCLVSSTSDNFWPHYSSSSSCLPLNTPWSSQILAIPGVCGLVRSRQFV